MGGLLILIVVILLILFFTWLEYYSHDCEGDKRCSHFFLSPEQNEETSSYIDKLLAGARNGINFVSWRLALLVALITTPLIIYCLYSRLPTGQEWIILVLIIFIGVSLSSSWLWYRFLRPNNQKLERALLELKYRYSSPSA